MSDRAELYDRLPLLETDRWWTQLASSSPDGRVLELGAGAGRLTAALVETGASVTAVERDPAMLELLTERVGDRVEIVRGDVTTLPSGTPVGLVVLPSSLLNELPDADARRSALAAAAARCRTDGAVALHLLAPGWLVGLVSRVRGELVPADGGPTIEMSIDPEGFDAARSRRRARLVYRFPDGAVLGDDLDAGVVELDELEASLHDAGLVLVQRLGASPPRPPRADDASWHVLARRADAHR